MKNYTLLILIIGFTLNAQAVDYTTAGTGGQWDLNATWNVGGSYPDDASDNAILNNGDSVWLAPGVTVTVSEIEFRNNSKLYVPETSTLIADSISVLNNADFYIDGTLDLTGGINMRNNSTLDVALTGNLDIGGDFYGSNNVSITNDGDMDIAGDLFLGAGATLEGEGTVTADTYSGTGTVFGSGMGDLTGTNTYEAGTNGEAWVLPIELSALWADKTDNSVVIYWTTISEENNDYFTIERSADGIYYEVLTTVQGAGNSYMELNYSFVDNNPLNGVSYYRLTQTDYNGKFETFNPISISFLNESAFTVGPNPATSYINISVDGEMGKSSINIFNLIGEVVKSVEVNDIQTRVDVSDLPKGAYMVVLAADMNKIVKRILVE